MPRLYESKDGTTHRHCWCRTSDMKATCCICGDELNGSRWELTDVRRRAWIHGVDTLLRMLLEYYFPRAGDKRRNEAAAQIKELLTTAIPRNFREPWRRYEFNRKVRGIPSEVA